MRKIILTLFLGISFLTTFAQEFPAKPNTLVNDYTGTLSSGEVQALENKLVAFDDSTSIQIAVAMITSLGGYDISDYGYQLGRHWGIGSKEKNTGVLVLVALNDKKVTIQTGYGMEGALPDAIAKRIIENEIKPRFRTGDYYGGINAATDAIISYSKGEYKNTAPKKRAKSGGIPAGLIVLIVIVVITLISRGGLGGGGGRNVIGSRGGADLMWWSLLAGLAGGGGRRGGGGWGGSSGGGFSGGGGSFGGFGGGSFGGGGASGSW